MKAITFYKNECKKKKKFNNPDRLTLMQIQNIYAKDLGYKNWGDLIKKEERKELIIINGINCGEFKPLTEK